MADLGSLYFDVLLRDKTAAERAKIKSDLLRDLQLKLDLTVDTRTLVNQIKNDLAAQRFKINVVVDKATASQAVQQALNSVRTWNGKYTADDLRAERAKTQQAIQQYKTAQAELAKVRAAHLAARDAASAHASASINLGGAMGSNITIAGRLGSAMAGLYSVHMAKEFLSNVIEIGGELEHQKIAMDTIFGDKGKTIDLFDKIKGLARHSPFGVMELTKSVKALSAYGVEYNEIYETAKRLADISAATSVDINRLILAFGKTKSRTFLDGLEAKQFAYANIPIYDMLSKKLTELEGKFVSVKEVMGRIKKREIGFDMVKEVLWDLTDEGGKFYNMQEALAGSVKTSWKLVKDNIELMYGELAESLAGPLKGVAELLQGMTRNWRTLAAVIGSAATLYGIYRLSMLATNVVIDKQTAGIYQNIIAEKQREAAKLRALRVTQKLDAAEIQLIATANKLTLADFQQAIAQGKLNSNDIIRLGTMGKLNKEQLIYAVRCGEISAAQARAVISGRVWGMNLGVLGNKIKALGWAVNGALKSLWAFATNPWTIAMSAIGGIVTLWSKNSQEMEKAKEIGDNLFTKATEGASNLQEIIKNIKPSEGLSQLELSQGVEQMISALKDYSPQPLHDINDALIDQNGNARSLAEQYDILKQRLESVAQAYEKVADMNLNNTITNAIVDSNGYTGISRLFSDDINTNAKDYQDAVYERDKAIRQYMTKNAGMVDRTIKRAAELDEKYAAAIAQMKTNEQKFAELIRNYSKYVKAGADYEIGATYREADDGKGDKMEAQWNTLAKDMATVWESISTQAKENGIESLADATDEIKEAYALMIKNWIEGLEVSPELKDAMFNYYANLLRFDFERFDAEGALLEGLEEKATALLGAELAEKVRNGLTLTPDEQKKVEDALKKVYKEMFKNAPELQKAALNEAVGTRNSEGGYTFSSGKLGRIIARMDVTLDWPDWQRELNKQFGGDPEIQAWLKGAADLPSFVKAAQEGYKDAKEVLDKLKPLALKAGISLDFANLKEIDTNSDEYKNAGAYARQLMDEYNQAVKAIKAAEKASKSMGFDPAGAIKTKKSSGGAKKDAFAEQIKERLNLLKNAYSEYKKWIDLIGKDEAMKKVKDSGMFSSLFSGKEPVNLDDYKNELTKLLNKLDDKTKERRELKVSIRKLLLDIDAEETKRAAEEAKEKMEREIANISKGWDIYNQLINAGASKADASKFAFGSAQALNSQAEALRADIEKRLKEKGLDIPVTLTEEEATARMGGKNSPLYNQFFNAWKAAKEAIEKDTLDVKLREVTAINNYKSIAEKIADLNEKYAQYTGTSVGENGELQAVDGMTEGQKALFREYQEKLAELKGELLTLLPVWEQIFGDHTYQSYGQIEKAAGIVKQIVANAQVQRNADGKPTIYTSSYIDDSGNTVNVSGQFAQLEKLKKAINDLYKEALKKNPFKTLWKNLQAIFGKNDDMKDKTTIEKVAMLGQSAAESAELVGGLANNLADMFEAMGADDAAKAMSTVGDVMNSISTIGQAFAQGGLIGGIAAAAGEAIGWITKIFQAHDNRLQKMIEESQRYVNKLQNLYDAIERRLARNLGSGKYLIFDDIKNDTEKINQLNAAINEIMNKGYVYWYDLYSLQVYTKEVERLQARIDAWQQGGAYGYQRQLMIEQLAELEKQRKAEEDKKKTDKDALIDYDNQIDELKVQIREFAEETADALYGINIKDWAAQIGDALFDAWKRGEDAAEAFKKTVANIMGDVMNSILKLAILEPAMEDLRKMLFGEDGMSGMFGADFELDEKELEQIGDYLMGLSDKSDSYLEALEMLDNYMQKKYGVSMKEDSDTSSNSLTKGIQSVTENTADLLASYINAIRADVSMKREYVRQLIEDLLPQYQLIAQAQLKQLEQIAANTMRNADAAEKILALINSNTNPGVGFKIS